jgi:dihydroorotate dehydrogenase electron transfer subunit
MYFLSKEAKGQGIESVAVIGGRSEKDIIWEKQLFAVCKEVFITTDDGSRGKKGNVMAEVTWLVEGKHVDCVYACGPERMMEAVAKLCKQHSIPCQISVERYMKCGVGVCGSCAIDGKFACVDGPVISGEEALALAEFGKSHRDASGLSQKL